MKAKSFVPFILLAILALVPAFISQQYVIHTFIIILLYMYWSSSWNIIGGYAGQFALGNAVYIGIGAYTTAVLFIYEAVTPWIGMLVGGAISAALSIVISYPCFKLRGTYFSLSTVALLHVVRLIVVSSETVLGYNLLGGLGMKIPWKATETNLEFINMQYVDKRGYFYIILGLLVVILLVSNYIRKSKTGYYLAAINTNQDASNSIGINVTSYKLRAQAISAFFMALGGAFYAMFVMFVEPTRVLGYDLSVEILMLVVIGGAGTLWGPIIGAAVLVPINEILRIEFGSKIAPLAIVVYGFILMIIVMFAPGGLLKLFKNLFGKIGKLFKKRVIEEKRGEAV